MPSDALACALLFVLHGAPSLAAPSIDLSLNVIYTNPANPLSGGIWELVAKTNPTASACPA